jgi:hypothetical protein
MAKRMWAKADSGRIYFMVHHRLRAMDFYDGNQHGGHLHNDIFIREKIRMLLMTVPPNQYQ